VLAADFGAIDALGPVKCVRADPVGSTLAVLTLERAVKTPGRIVTDWVPPRRRPWPTRLAIARRRWSWIWSPVRFRRREPTLCPNGAGSSRRM